MSAKLKIVKENSWIVLDEGDKKTGLLSLVNGEYFLIHNGVMHKFRHRQDVNSYFSKDVFEVVEALSAMPLSNGDQNINGYPVDFDKPIEVKDSGYSLPVFSKKETSKVFYAAGYYCLKYPTGWTQAFCPKIATLESYVYTGPFKTVVEMKSELLRLKRADNG